MHPHTYTRALNRRHTLHGAIPVPPPLRKIIISRTSPHGHNGWSPPLQWLLLLLLLLLKFHRHLVHGRRRLLGHGDMHSVNRKNFMPRNIIYYINARPRKKIKNVFIFILCSCIFLIFFFLIMFYVWMTSDHCFTRILGVCVSMVHSRPRAWAYII